MAVRSKYLLPRDARKLVDLLKASLSDYTRNGGRKIDWLQKVGVSSRTWYKWVAQECPRIRKKTSVRITKFANLDVSDLPEFINESINPTIFLNKSFNKYLDTYFNSDLVVDAEKVILLSGFFVLSAAEIGVELKHTIDISNASSSIIDTTVNCYIKVYKDNYFVFDLFKESTLVCKGEFNTENIKILIKWLHKQRKLGKTKTVNTLYEQFRNSIAK